MCLLGDGGLPVDKDKANRYLDLAETLGYDVDDALGAMGMARDR